MFKYLKLLIMSRIQEHVLSIKAGHGFLLLGIGLCLYQMYFCVMYNTWEFVTQKSYDEKFMSLTFLFARSRPFLPMLCNNSTYTNLSRPSIFLYMPFYVFTCTMSSSLLRVQVAMEHKKLYDTM